MFGLLLTFKGTGKIIYEFSQNKSVLSFSEAHVIMILMPKVRIKHKKRAFLGLSLAISLFLNVFLSIYSFSLKMQKENEINVLETYVLPPLLANYRDGTFRDSLIPRKSPFGGNGMEYTRITAGFKEKAYQRQFGEVHVGLDIVPSDDYSKNNIAYLVSKRPIIFATHSGKVDYFYDENRANYLVITNNNETLRTMYVHLKASYLKSGVDIVAGTPIGIMGSTGKSTGEHVHYAVQIKDKEGEWVYVDPMGYISNSE